jgi:hypothetical protein
MQNYHVEHRDSYVSPAELGSPRDYRDRQSQAGDSHVGVRYLLLELIVGGAQRRYSSKARETRRGGFFEV